MLGDPEGNPPLDIDDIYIGFFPDENPLDIDDIYIGFFPDENPPYFD